MEGVASKLPIIRAAAVQAEPIILDLDATVAKACDLIREAAQNGAKLVVSPEMLIPTYVDGSRPRRRRADGRLSRRAPHAQQRGGRGVSERTGGLRCSSRRSRAFCSSAARPAACRRPCRRFSSRWRRGSTGAGQRAKSRRSARCLGEISSMRCYKPQARSLPPPCNLRSISSPKEIFSLPQVPDRRRPIASSTRCSRTRL